MRTFTLIAAILVALLAGFSAGRWSSAPSHTVAPENASARPSERGSQRGAADALAPSGGDNVERPRAVPSAPASESDERVRPRIRELEREVAALPDDLSAEDQHNLNKRLRDRKNAYVDSAR